MKVMVDMEIKKDLQDRRGRVETPRSHSTADAGCGDFEGLSFGMATLDEAPRRTRMQKLLLYQQYITFLMERELMR